MKKVKAKLSLRPVSTREEAVSTSVICQNVQRDLSTQRFQFTFGLSWKASKRLCNEKEAGLDSLKDDFRHAFMCENVQDEKVWCETSKNKNLISYACNESSACEIFFHLSQYFNVRNLLKPILSAK